eukprot:gene17505-8704_t
MCLRVHARAFAAWSLGQIGRHTPEHAKSVADCGVLPKLLDVYLDREASDDLKTKAKRALKSIVQKCVHLPALWRTAPHPYYLAGCAHDVLAPHWRLCRQWQAAPTACSQKRARRRPARGPSAARLEPLLHQNAPQNVLKY